MKVSIIAAVSRNRVIGRDQELPWSLPNDLKRFKQLTMGKPIIMGRKTFESIGRALPGRINIVISRDPNYKAPPDCLVEQSLFAAISAVPNAEEVMIIGGASLYEEALPRADCLYLTRVEADIEGDTYFPEFNISRWEPVSLESFPADEKHAFPYMFEVLERCEQS